MTVQGQASFTVSLDALVAAVKAVEPHASRSTKGDDALARVRFIAHRDELHVVATNGSTAAQAAVPIDPDSDSRGDDVRPEDDGVFTLDCEAAEVRNIPRRFLRGRTGKESPRRTVLLHFTDHTLQIADVTDAAGVGTLELDGGDVPDVPARQLGLVMLEPHADYPDVPGDLARALAGVGETVEAKPLVTDQATLGLFASAGVAYRQPLEFVASGSAQSRGFVVLGSQWFIGSVSSRHNDDDSLGKRSRARLVHLHRLLGQPLPESVPELDDEDVPPQVDDEAEGDDGGGTQPLELAAPKRRRARKSTS
jgi:hypothetical protein